MMMRSMRRLGQCSQCGWCSVSTDPSLTGHLLSFIGVLQYYLSQISPTSTSKLELDGITIVNSGKNNCHHVAKLNASSDLDMDEHDLFVHVDNPEKHVTAMETYITFRVITKVSHFKCLQIH